MSDDTGRGFEDLTLAELIDQFVKSPARTWRSLNAILRSQTAAPAIPTDSVNIPAQTTTWRDRLPAVIASKQNAQLLLYLLAVLCAVFGNALLHGSAETARTEANALAVGAPFLWLAGFIWLLAELVGSWTSLKAWWHRIDRLSKLRWLARLLPLMIWLTALMLLTDSMTASTEWSLALVLAATVRFGLGGMFWLLIEAANEWMRNHSTRFADWVQTSPPPQESRGVTAQPFPRKISRKRATLFILAASASILVWLNTSGSRIAPPIILLWIASALLWAWVFAPSGWNIFDWAADRIDACRRIRWREYRWAILAFAAVMILGMSFRLSQLDAIPPEMSSDHVEKILDSYRVAQGEHLIFFANNGGREPLQMYLMSMLASLPGLDFNHGTLKLLTVLEGLITLPVLFMVGIELMGERQRKFGILVGLMLAGLVAVSSWHVTLSRLGLRIVLTPLFTALLMIYLARAMRHNRRSDYIKAALVLGFGLYSYQAVRMLPVVTVAGLAVATIIRQITWRERLGYMVNLGVLVWVSFMVFLPLFHYSLGDPEHFWMRTSGRILGDRVTAEEQPEAFASNVPILMSNIRNVLLMFNWRGDVIWLHGVPKQPTMDIYSGAFLILGLAAWTAQTLKSRDPVLWFMPVMILIMLLPSALAIAFPAENPSHTRVSGALAPVYLMAALPAATIAFHLLRTFPRRIGSLSAVIFCAAVLLLAHQHNSHLYFNRFYDSYIESTNPYRDAGSVLRGFAESDGSYGNAFIIAYPHFWDHRAVGIEAGQPLWPNSFFLPNLPRGLQAARQRSGIFALNPNRDLLFFYSPDDKMAPLKLREWFPQGRELERQSNHPDDRYTLYRVPSLGEAGLEEFLGSQS